MFKKLNWTFIHVQQEYKYHDHDHIMKSSMLSYKVAKMQCPTNQMAKILYEIYAYFATQHKSITILFLVNWAQLFHPSFSQFTICHMYLLVEYRENKPCKITPAREA